MCHSTRWNAVTDVVFNVTCDIHSHPDTVSLLLLLHKFLISVNLFRYSISVFPQLQLLHIFVTVLGLLLTYITLRYVRQITRSVVHPDGRRYAWPATARLLVHRLTRCPGVSWILDNRTPCNCCSCRECLRPWDWTARRVTNQIFVVLAYRAAGTLTSTWIHIHSLTHSLK